MENDNLTEKKQLQMWLEIEEEIYEPCIDGEWYYE